MNPAAKGWSRRPLHRANLRGRWGRNKRWDYWAVLAGDLVVVDVYADVDYLGLADVWWADLATGDTGGRAAIVPAREGCRFPSVPAPRRSPYTNDGLDLSITDDDAGTRLVATWTETDGRPGALDVLVELPPGHESLNVVIPWSDERFKLHVEAPGPTGPGRAARSATARGRSAAIGGDAWGVLDVGRGRWPYAHQLELGRRRRAAAGGHVVGLQIGGKWTEGTGFTENGIIVDGRLTKIGAELDVGLRLGRAAAAVARRDPAVSSTLDAHPRFDKHTRIEAGDHRQRDAPGVRHVVGHASPTTGDPRTPSTTCRASPRSHAGAGEPARRRCARVPA